MAVADIVIYALGGGMGHLVRSVAIARAIGKTGDIEAAVLTNPGFAHMIDREGVRAEIVDVPDDPAEYRKIIIDQLEKLSPRLLVVDALPMGLMGELREFLPTFEGPKIFMARILRADYRQVMDIDRFLADRFDMVIKTEFTPGWEIRHPNLVEVNPVLIRNADEIPSRKKARKILKVPPDRFLVLAVSTHQPLRADAFFQMVYHALRRIGQKRAVVKFASPYGEPDPSNVHTSYFPLMELLPGADVVAGHAGYHMVHETAAVGVPFLSFPQEKLYDDQQARSESGDSNVLVQFKSPTELEEGLRRAMRLKKSARNTGFRNGATEAARAIIEMAGGKYPTGEESATSYTG